MALYRHDHLALVPPPGEVPETEGAAQVLEYLRSHGASFYRDLYAAAGGGRHERVVDALWALVWAGYITNDSLEPLRAMLGSGSRRKSSRSRLGHLTRLGPAEVAGRWSLVPRVDQATERAAATVQMLLDRYGVVTRETVSSENFPGGFAAIYPVLKLMEEGGRVRRGYFVEGLGGAQFAVPAAVDRLRAERETPDAPVAVRLPATDPANPYGTALAWDGRRLAGNSLVMVDGRIILYLDHGGDNLVVAVEALEPEVLDAALDVLGNATIATVAGEPVLRSPFVPHLAASGFERDYLSMRRRANAELSLAGR